MSTFGITFSKELYKTVVKLMADNSPESILEMCRIIDDTYRCGNADGSSGATYMAPFEPYSDSAIMSGRID